MNASSCTQTTDPVAGDHAVVATKRSLGRPVIDVRRDRRVEVVRIDQLRPQLGVGHERLRRVAEDRLDLGAHVGDAAATRELAVFHVDVDGRGDVLDENLQTRAGLLDLAGRVLERRGRAAETTYEHDP